MDSLHQLHLNFTSKMDKFLHQLTRRKQLETLQKTNASSSLQRSLGLFDLIFMGVGSTLGVGIYILSGSVAKDDAGPAIVVSFLIAAIVSILAGICYAEFSARAPGTGSIYTYTYMALGEFLAFLMGWNMIAQYIIGSASVIKALSVYCDSFFNYTIQNHLREAYEINIPYMSGYFDVVAFAVSIFIAIILSYGLQESMILNNILTSVNIFMVLFSVVLGITKIDWNNWNLNVTKVDATLSAGSGGFWPYGLEGVIRGATSCFYGFIGFDCIVTTGCEVIQPKKTIPLALITSIMISFLAYSFLSSVLTLMVPYYLMDDTAPLSFAFGYVGLQWAQIIVKLGSFFGLSASLIGAFFPTSRIIYAMSQDGLLFRVLGRLDKKRGTPVVATMFTGLLIGITAAVLDVKHLIDLNSLGTLLSYCVVAVCVIVLTYSEDTRNKNDRESTPLLQPKKYDVGTNRINPGVMIYTIIFCTLAISLSLVVGLKFSWKSLPVSLLSLGMIIVLFLVKRQTPTEERQHYTFKVPLVPFIPALSILLDVFLLAQFDGLTWMRFCFWLVFGLIIYFSYGIFHSNERRNKPTN